MIDLNPGEDQRQILDAARALLKEHFPIERLRAPGLDRIEEIAAFGGLGLALSEDEDGAGFSVIEEALLHVELGRHLVSPCALAGTLAARIAPAALRFEILSGSTRVALAHMAGDEVRIVDAPQSSHALLIADGNIRLLDLSGHAVETLGGMDESLSLASIPDDGEALASSTDSRLLRHVDLLVSAQLLGIAEAVRDMAVDYAKVRQQFGRPIGAFQAVKHRAANMTIETDRLSAQLIMAAMATREDWPDAGFQTAAARRLAGRAALANARACIQIHGGIGFSSECDAHHYLKRAHALDQTIGGTDILTLDAPLSPLERT